MFKRKKQDIKLQKEKESQLQAETDYQYFALDDDDSLLEMSKKSNNQQTITQKKLKNSFSTTSSSSSNSSPESSSSTADELTSSDEKLTKHLKSDFSTSNSNSSSSDLSSESSSSNSNSDKSNDESELDPDEQKVSKIDLNNLFNGVSKSLVKNSRKTRNKKPLKLNNNFKSIGVSNLSDREMIENVLNKRPCLTNLTNSTVIAKSEKIVPKTSPVKAALSSKCSSSMIEVFRRLFVLFIKLLRNFIFKFKRMQMK